MIEGNQEVQGMFGMAEKKLFSEAVDAIRKKGAVAPQS